MLNFEKLTFRYDPYPIGFARDVLPEQLYLNLVESFPVAEKMRLQESLGRKYLLTEFDGDAYYDAVTGSTPWRAFYEYIKSRAFVDQMLDLLCTAKIDLGLKGVPVVTAHPLTRALPHYRDRLLRSLNRLIPNSSYRYGWLTSRFEFSALPGDGWHVPHTDAPSKIISLVLSMVRQGEWNPAWGGGTAICKPKDPTDNFNHLNRYLSFEDVDVLDSFPFVANGCVIFVKTFNSYHAVMPCTADDPSRMRNSVTINISFNGRL